VEVEGWAEGWVEVEGWVQEEGWGGSREVVRPVEQCTAAVADGAVEPDETTETAETGDGIHGTDGARTGESTNFG
jgi:hypothetical protein